MNKVETIDRRIESMKKRTKLVRKYSLTWSEPDSLVHPRGAWVIRNERDGYVKDFASKSKKQKAIDYLNELNEYVIRDAKVYGYIVADYDAGEYEYSPDWENSYWEKIRNEMLAKLEQKEEAK